MKAANKGDKDSANKLIENMMQPFLSTLKSGWQEKIDSVLLPMSQWYDTVLSQMNEGGGLGSVMSAALKSGGGLEALGVDNEMAAEALMPMWKSLGLETTEDAKALLDGLQEAGFDGLMGEFLGELMPQGGDILGAVENGMKDWGIKTDPESLKGMEEGWKDWMKMLMEPM